MKKLMLLLLLCLPFGFLTNAHASEVTADFSCNWNWTYNYSCGQHYNAGHNLYVKANPSRHQDIDWMELYVNNQFVRKESSYPYEWCKPNSGGDNLLRNMQQGTYQIKIRSKDRCGQLHEKTCVVYIDGNGNSGGGSTANCRWDWTYNYSCGQHYNAGHNLYVKANPERHQDIDWMELYVNNQFVRKESQYPYEWCKPNTSGDNLLRNMQQGTYHIKIKTKDKCGQMHEKTCVVYIDGNGNSGGGSTANCRWNWNWNWNCGQHYSAGHNLYVKANPERHQDIEWMELYVNNNFVRKETSYPYEWCKPNSGGDNRLRNMQPGSYTIKIKTKDRCGQYHEKTCVVHIDGGGNNAHCQWNSSYQYPNNSHYPRNTNLYVKVHPQKHQDIEWMELYVNGNFVRKESSYPYEWCKQGSSGDNRLRNMQPGTYTLKCKIKDKCGQYHEKMKTIQIQH